jgi:hypothetical protein
LQRHDEAVYRFLAGLSRWQNAERSDMPGPNMLLEMFYVKHLAILYLPNPA